MKKSKHAKIYAFNTHQDVIAFAKVFFDHRIAGFRKDIEICMKANRHGSHGYMPALMSCLAVLDLLTALYTGKPRKTDHDDFLDYAERFLVPVGQYDRDRLKILYVGFRHKLAHFNHPYPVLDLSRDKRFDCRKERLAFSIQAAYRNPPIQVVPVAKRLIEAPMPWATYCDHQIKIAIPSLARDAIKSVYGPQGYLKGLQRSAELRTNFRKCMEEFYPR